ncbi:unnamed protein product [Lactuca virosa]|uniref:Uncharacterized protein n=1 Tax=Lactuca virosa TaxID=75947 RepID=A0AAU9MEI2_9ASTR|nr:unnamed protein product [Lactuca virosa]CAH1428849.1 unnamed protein product [Lactuca virosa]
MATHDDINASSIENEDEAWVIDSIEKAIPPPLSSARIPRVPKILVCESSDIYEKYYVPKVVSIGPYHHNNQKLELVEKLKPVFTKELLSKYKVGLSTLYKKLGTGSMVQELRNFYEERSTDHLSSKEFTMMMLLDGCFILYYILFIYGEKPGSCKELRSHQIVFIQQDLFLLENQIPFKVINEVMNLINLTERRDKIRSFFTNNILVPGRQKRGWFGFRSGSTQNDQYFGSKLVADHHHLLHRLHSSLTRTSEDDAQKDEISNRCTFRNVNELADVGIQFKPSSVMSLAHVEFVGRWWWFSANVKLPPITVDDSTKPMLLNLIAYEMCAEDAHDAWVTSYICLLDSLIDHPEDVKALRKAGVLDNSLGSDKEVATMFNEIGTDLVPNNLAYSKAKYEIQKHYDSLRNTRFSQLKHEYIKSPWSFLALVGAVVALFLSGVQTYFTVWGPPGECDDLCKFLKLNHHL